MFDLPVADKKDRKSYAKFRHFLLDQGFQMAQFSIYYRLVPSKEAGEKYVKDIKENLPEYGTVQVLSITDKQYENIQTFIGRRKKSAQKQEQLWLF